MKASYTNLTAGIVLGLSLGAPLPGLAAGGEYGGDKGSATSASQVDKKMTEMAAAELGGKAVVNRNGEEIGEVERVVRRAGDGRYYAVVSVGGFLGIGDEQVMVPLEELRIEGGRLYSTAASTEEELERRAAYDAGVYQQVEGDRMVRLGTAQETGGMGAAAGQESAGGAARTGESRVGFGTLDVNRDGYLSKDEAAEAPRLVDNWQSADTNDDGRLDRAEFAAFEPMPQEQAGQKKDQAGQKERMPAETGGRGY